MPLEIALACLDAGLTPEEGEWAATAGGATALGLSDRGALTPGSLGDLVVLDADSPVHLAYRPGGVPTAAVIKRGEVVVRGGRPEMPASGNLLG